MQHISHILFLERLLSQRPHWTRSFRIFTTYPFALMPVSWATRFICTFAHRELECRKVWKIMRIVQLYVVLYAYVMEFVYSQAQQNSIRILMRSTIILFISRLTNQNSFIHRMKDIRVLIALNWFDLTKMEIGTCTLNNNNNNWCWVNVYHRFIHCSWWKYGTVSNVYTTTVKSWIWTCSGRFFSVILHYVPIIMWV